MRILYLHQYFNTPDMPGSTRSYEIARRLVNAGHHVTLLTTDRSTERGGWRVSDEAGIEVHWIPVPYSNRASFAQRLWAFVKFAVRSTVHGSRMRCDLVYATSTPLTIAVPGMIAAFVQRAPFVFEVRDLWPEVPIIMGVLKNPILKRLSLWLERLSYRRAAGIVALSPGMADHVRAKSAPDKSIIVVPNGCDTELFDAASGHAEQLRADNDLFHRGPVVVYTGTLGYVNGPVYVAELAAAARDVQFVVVGGGREEQSLRFRAEELGVLGENLHLMGEAKKAQAAAWVEASSACLSLIRPERHFWVNAVTNKVFDYLAAGRPVLANHAGWQMDAVTEANAGVVLSRDPEEAAKTLATLFADPAGVDAMGKAARALAEDRFSRDKQVAELADYLVAIQAQSGRPVAD